MSKTFLVCLFAAISLFSQPLCLGDPRPKSSCAGWESLQQIRSLIPERMWEQDFAIRIDRKGFKKAFSEWSCRGSKGDFYPSRYVVAVSSNFYLRSTMTGENIRIDDRYEEFHFSPFWNYPPRVSELHSLEKKILKGGK